MTAVVVFCLGGAPVVCGGVSEIGIDVLEFWKLFLRCPYRDFVRMHLQDSGFEAAPCTRGSDDDTTTCSRLDQ